MNQYESERKSEKGEKENRLLWCVVSVIYIETRLGRRAGIGRERPR